jgi:PAS domain S-box-containing protein
MIMVDQSGKIALVNSFVEALFGYTRDELIGKPISMIVSEASENRNPEYRGLFISDPETRALRIGEDLYGLQKDGRQFPSGVGLSSITTTQNESFVLASIIDISERKRAEDFLQEKLLESHRSNQKLQQFAYVCSHDLQESLRVISNYTQLLAKRYQGQLVAKADQYVGFTIEATRRMQELINDLLLYSRVETKAQN